MIARSLSFVVLLLALVARRGHAQCSGTGERDRDDWLSCQSLIRMGGARVVPESLHSELRIRELPIRLASGWNSRLPYSVNDGALWSGRGWSARLGAGVQTSYGRFTASLEPEFLAAQNLPFPILPADPATGRNPYGNPFHQTGRTVDMPLRFGASSLWSLAPGQSFVEVRLPYIAVGVTSENQWWGPGIRNALVMSDNAAGVPQLYVRSATPIRTFVGDLEGRLLLGTLTESRFFDGESRDDLRSLSGAILTLRARFDSGLVIGAARVSFANLGALGRLPSHLLDFAFTLPRGERDELQSLFARWVFPDAGLEVHSEWARPHVPSLRELLLAPQRTEGYTIGAQWRGTGAQSIRPVVRTEFTMLEQTAAARGADVLTFYTSARVPQGYTQRGQVIGAAIGPGSSSQFVAAGLETNRGAAELLATRIRSDDDAYYRQPAGFAHFSHDVSLMGGLRLAANANRWTGTAELLTTHRMNYLFQTANVFTWNSAFDMHNATANFSLTFRP
jgi:hypothetical protein